MNKFFALLLFFPVLLHAETYTFSGGQNNLVHKIAAEVLHRAYAKAGIPIKTIFINLQESLNKSNAGITDGEIARIEKITKYTPNLIQVPVSIMSVQAVAYSKNSSLVINSWKDLNGHKITIAKGAKFIEASTRDIERTFAPSFEAALDLLNEDKTEIVVVPKLAGLKIIHQKKYHKIKAISPVLQKLKMYHFVHKKNRHLLPVITPIFKQMKESGEIAFIRKSMIEKTADSILK